MLEIIQTRLRFLATSLALLGPATTASAAWPERPIRLVVGYTPGSAADVAGRIVAEELGGILGQRIIIENKPGAASNTAAESVARAEPDGYTLFLSNIANVINSTLKKGASIDLSKELKPDRPSELCFRHSESSSDSLANVFRVRTPKVG